MRDGREWSKADTSLLFVVYLILPTFETEYARMDGRRVIMGVNCSDDRSSRVAKYARVGSSLSLMLGFGLARSIERVRVSVGRRAEWPGMGGGR